MDHDDWDSETADTLFHILFWYDGKPSWLAVFIFLFACALLGYHCFGH